MAEEHGFRASEGHKCYRDLILEQGRTKGADLVDSTPPGQGSQPAALSSPARHARIAAVAAEVQLPANRCSACRKKVGLTGFRCRCGVTFCGTHRYPEMHGCAFNYKDAGREAIAKANPPIKALKLEKI
ncbi:unnamed protein product [Cuscuta campestris]|uniref:AN1-type domain-containing protein n=1 Tax=Cuscuta campestris TaxID=132261 RepID=A0A484KAW9_9ASTE|nr:unnamed protein product [Cuscuta campestris]